MGLGGKVDDGVHPFGRTQDRLPVADVCANETIARIRLDLAQVVGVAGVSELVQVHDLHRVPALPAEQPADEVGADEAGAPANQDPHVYVPPRGAAVVRDYFRARSATALRTPEKCL